MELIDKIVENVEKRRKGLSIDKLGKIANLPSSTIIKILRKDVRDVRISTLAALAKALNCTVNDLIE